MKRPQKLAVMLVPTPPYEICGIAPPKMTPLKAETDKWKISAVVHQPQFFVEKATTATTLKNGGARLVAVHKPSSILDEEDVPKERMTNLMFVKVTLKE